MKPVTLGIYGESNSGKTKLLTQLIRQYNQKGYFVAAIKMSSKDCFDDAENTDTYRYHKAGSNLMVFSGNKEFFFHGIKAFNELEIINHCMKFGHIDIVLIEGSSHPDIPKIRIGTIKQRPNTVMNYEGTLQPITDYLDKKLKTLQQKPIAIQLFVDGKMVLLSEFPADIIMNSVVAMIQTLKGVTHPKHIVLQINQK